MFFLHGYRMPNFKCPVEFIEFTSNDPEMASKSVSALSTPSIYSALTEDSYFQMAIRLARVDAISVWESSSTTGFTMALEATQHPRVELHFVEKGRVRSKTENSVIDASAGEAFLLRDVKQHNMVSEPGTSQICVAIPSARCIRLIAREFGDPLGDISVMHSTVGGSQSSLRCLKDAAKLLISVSSSGPSSGGSSLGAKLLRDAFLAIFVESWPRAGGYRISQTARPYYVKRAIEWMHANATQKFSLEDLAAASGVSIRTLQLGFRNFSGQSPMGYLLNLRLECAYNDLLTEPTATTIEEIARRWGFSNPGNFAAQIRKLYGKNPLTIRKSSRERSPRLKLEH